MKNSTERCSEMQRMETKPEAIVSRLCAEFKNSFWVQGDRLMEEYVDFRGQLARRCLAYVD